MLLSPRPPPIPPTTQKKSPTPVGLELGAPCGDLVAPGTAPLGTRGGLGTGSVSLWGTACPVGDRHCIPLGTECVPFGVTQLVPLGTHSVSFWGCIAHPIWGHTACPIWGHTAHPFGDTHPVPFGDTQHIPLGPGPAGRHAVSLAGRDGGAEQGWGGRTGRVSQ